MTEVERELLSLVIGHRIREARKVQRMSQSALAQGIGSQSMISLIESGRQLPLSDVLCLVAKRLDDPTLLHYAELLGSGSITTADISASDHEVLWDAIRTHRGKWHDIHGTVALQLCQHFYTQILFEVVDEICRLITEHSDNPHHLALAHFYRGSTYLCLGRYPEAEDWLLQAEQNKEQLPGIVQGRLYYNLAYAYTSMDMQGIAMWYAKRATELFQNVHEFGLQAKALGMLGTVQGRLGRLEEAKNALQLAYEISTKWEIGEVDQVRIEALLANLYLTAGDYQMAEKWVDHALPGAERARDLESVCSLYRVQFRLQTHRGTMVEARHALVRAIVAAEQLGSTALAHTYLLAAGCLSSTDERLRAAQRAYEVTRDSNCAVEHALAAECLAGLYEQAGDQEQAHHYSKAALASYRNHVQRNSMFRYILKTLPLQGAL